MRRVVVALFFLMPVSFVSVHAQRLLPFDADGRIFVVTKELETRYQIFRIKGFEAARLLQATDSTSVLELTINDSLGMRQESRSLTSQELLDLRDRWKDRVQAAASNRGTAEPISVEGRSRLVQTITGLGIGWYGWTIPAIVGSDNGAASMSLYLLTAGLTYVAADRLLAERSYSEAEGAAFIYFATRGILHGVAINTLIAGDYKSMRTGFAAGTAFSLLEGLTLSKVAARGSLTHGDVRSMSATGDAGVLLGLGFAYASARSDRPFFDDAGDRPRPYAASVLLGNIVGIAGGWLLNRSGSIAPGDGDLIESAGYLGSSAGFAIADLSGVTDRRRLVVSAMAGLAAGQATGLLLARHVDLTSSEGQRLTLLTSGGVFVGLGIAYATGASQRRAFFFSAATVGGMAGMLIAYARTPEVSSGSDHASIRFRPDGLLMPVERVEGSDMACVRPFATFTLAW